MNQCDPGFWAAICWYADWIGSMLGQLFRLIRVLLLA